MLSTALLDLATDNPAPRGVSSSILSRDVPSDQLIIYPGKAMVHNNIM